MQQENVFGLGLGSIYDVDRFKISRFTTKMRRRVGPFGAFCIRLLRLPKKGALEVGERSRKIPVPVLVLRDGLCIVAIACRNFFSREHTLTGGEGRNCTEFTGDANAHILWRSRCDWRAAACAFALYIYAAQQLCLGSGRLRQLGLVIASVSGGMCLRRGEQKHCAQSGGSRKGTHAGGNWGENHHVILQLYYIFKSQPEALVPCL